MKPAAPNGGPCGKMAGGAATLGATRLARLERLTKVPPFSLIALGRAGRDAPHIGPGEQ
jgi:hypothetical protein